MIKKLDLYDKLICRKILDLQKLSYQVEADLIGFDDIPTLNDSIKSLMDSHEIFYGYFMDQNLVGIIAYEVNQDIGDICRLAIHPSYFRKNIAQNLLHHIEELNPNIDRWYVTTGKDNIPAIKFYIKLGYKKVKDFKVNEKLWMSKFQKIKGSEK
jgi:ribosomal protein S18 acetylase RimI-like enzyme